MREGHLIDYVARVLGRGEQFEDRQAAAARIVLLELYK